MDIRKNGGGSIPTTCSPILTSPITLLKKTCSFYPLQKSLIASTSIADDSTDITDIEENLREEHNQFRNGRYYQNLSFNPFWQPDSLTFKGRFKGRIYLLIGPAVASALLVAASIARSDEGSSMVIGEESIRRLVMVIPGYNNVACRAALYTY